MTGAPDAGPQIATIIPTYRRPRLLRRAVKSVLAQTFSDFQVRVYDNASGDETKDVVAELAAADPRVRYYCHPQNIGGNNNYTYGQHEVDTPFFSFLADDDVLLPEFFATAMSGFANHPRAMMSACSTLEMTPSGDLLLVSLATWPREGLYEAPETLRRMLDGHHPSWPAVLFRRQTIDDVGYLAYDNSLSDLDFEMRIAARFPIVISLKPGGIFVRHPLSGSSRVRPDWLEDYAALIERFKSEGELTTQDRRQIVRGLSTLATRRSLEFGAKALLQREYGAVRDIARFLRREFHRPFLGSLLAAGGAACAAVPPFTLLVGWFASLVLGLRSWACVARSRASASPNAPRDFSEYVKYLEIPEAPAFRARELSDVG